MAVFSGRFWWGNFVLCIAVFSEEIYMVVFGEEIMYGGFCEFGGRDRAGGGAAGGAGVESASASNVGTVVSGIHQLLRYLHQGKSQKRSPTYCMNAFTV